MAYQAVHRFARISARKVRPLADLIRGKHADEALDILRVHAAAWCPAAGEGVEECLGQCRRSPGSRMQNLVVIDARVDGGPMFKRVRPRARGMAFMIKKRM